MSDPKSPPVPRGTRRGTRCAPTRRGGPLGNNTITNDALSRVHTVEDGKGQTKTYSYDDLDRVTEMSYSNGQTIDYSYDANGNLTERDDSVNGITGYVELRRLDLSGHLAQLGFLTVVGVWLACALGLSMAYYGFAVLTRSRGSSESYAPFLATACRRYAVRPRPKPLIRTTAVVSLRGRLNRVGVRWRGQAEDSAVQLRCPTGSERMVLVVEDAWGMYRGSTVEAVL